MLYRRKVLLALLEALGRQVTRPDLQKYLFLLSREQEHPSYYFIPYRYGCYSFSADADKHALTKNGFVKSHDRWVLTSSGRHLSNLRPVDRTAIRTIVSRFKHLRGRPLVRHVYAAHPYYAINSDILEQILDSAERRRVDTARPRQSTPCLFTLGYQGLTLEQYLNKLIENAVSVLCDVRRNAVSMKYGFSKRTLDRACKQTGISYIHMPELGVESNRRKNLRSQADYDSLFHKYGETTLIECRESIESIMRLVNENGRVALTCFEADSARCHRSHVADAIVAGDSFGHPVSHI